MSTTRHPQALRRHALLRLVEDARREAAASPMGSADHHFFEGVATAAEDLLHPDRTDVHDDGWLSRETPAFRNGYLEASALAAAAVDRAPLRFILPTPGRHG